MFKKKKVIKNPNKPIKYKPKKTLLDRPLALAMVISVTLSGVATIIREVNGIYETYKSNK